MKFIKKILIIAVLIAPGISNAQTAQMVNHGAKIVVQNGAKLVLQGAYTASRYNTGDGQIDLDGIMKISGNFTNNSQSNAFANPDTDGELIFNGVLPQTVAGVYNSTFIFENLSISNGSTLMFTNVPARINGVANLGGTAPCVQIGLQDLTINGNILGSGQIQAISNGALIMTAQSNLNKIFPISDGINNYSVTVNCNQAANLRVRLLSSPNALADYICEITHTEAVPVGFNAALIMRLDKSALPGGIMPASYRIKHDDGKIPADRVANIDYGTYYEITTTNISSF